MMSWEESSYSLNVFLILPRVDVQHDFNFGIHSSTSLIAHLDDTRH